MLKKVLLVVLAIILLAIVAAGIFIWQFELDDYRQDLEVAIADQTGLDVTIAGGLSLVGKPKLELGAGDVTFESRGAELAKLEKLIITVDWEPLLNRELYIEKVEIESLGIKLQLDEDGNLILPEFPGRNTDAKESKPGVVGLPLKKALIDKILVKDLVVTIEQSGEQAGEVVRVQDLDFSLENLLIADNETLLIGDWPNYLEHASLESKLEIALVKYLGHELNEIQVDASHEGKVVNYDLSLNAYGGSATGSGSVDWQAGAISSRSELTAQSLSLSEILKSLALDQKGEGVFNLAIKGSSKIEAEKTWLQNLVADAQLTGEELVIDGLDIDKLVTKLVESQKLNLKDLGGFALAGPLALLVTKGGSYTGILQGALAGETKIPTLFGDWHVAEQQVEFSDVAFITQKTRLAVKGHIDLEQQAYGPLKFYVLNRKGCSLLKRELAGTLAEPELGTIEFAASSLLNPLLSILDQGQDLLIECKPVYEGKVAHPDSGGGEKQEGHTDEQNAEQGSAPIEE